MVDARWYGIILPGALTAIKRRANAKLIYTLEMLRLRRNVRAGLAERRMAVMQAEADLKKVDSELVRQLCR